LNPISSDRRRSKAIVIAATCEEVNTLRRECLTFSPVDRENTNHIAI
jgi:hypothetical protein